MRENSVYGGLGSWLIGSLLGSKKTTSEAKAQSFVEKSIEPIEQLPPQDKIETLAKASSFFTGKKTGSLGLVVVGSIIGGILASRACVGKVETVLEDDDDADKIEHTYFPDLPEDKRTMPDQDVIDDDGNPIAGLDHIVDNYIDMEV